MARDYAAEYRRRLEKAAREGRSVSSARGHGAPRTGFDRRLQTITRDIGHGRYKSATEAARRTHTPVEKLRNYMRETGQAHKQGGRYVYGPEGGAPRGTYHVPLFSGGRLYEVDVSEATASTVGKYMSAVRKFIRSGDESALADFVDVAVSDVNGQNYVLETDLDALTDLYTYEDLSWDDIYRRNG